MIHISKKYLQFAAYTRPDLIKSWSDCVNLFVIICVNCSLCLKKNLHKSRFVSSWYVGNSGSMRKFSDHLNSADVRRCFVVCADNCRKWAWSRHCYQCSWYLTFYHLFIIFSFYSYFYYFIICMCKFVNFTQCSRNVSFKHLVRGIPFAFFRFWIYTVSHKKYTLLGEVVNSIPHLCTETS